MAWKRLYIGLENLALSVAQRNLLVSRLESLGKASDPSPAHLNHRRYRLDNQAGIYEALYDEATVTLDASKQWLADIFLINPSLITTTQVSTAYGLLITYRYLLVDYIRLLMFGGATATLEQSRADCLEYLRDNAAAWGDNQ